MSNICKKIAKANKAYAKKRRINAIQNYIDYFMERGAKNIHIETPKFNGDSFVFHSDVVLSMEEIQSEEYMILTKELAMALTA